MYRSHILVCAGTNCQACKCEKVAEYFEKKLVESKLNEEVKVVKTGCFGLCAFGPVIVVYPEGVFYQMVTEDGAAKIFEEHILKGRIVTELIYEDSKKDDAIKTLESTDFFKKQVRIALRNCGVINPEEINEYIALDALYKCAEIYADAVLEIVKL